MINYILLYLLIFIIILIGSMSNINWNYVIIIIIIGLLKWYNNYINLKKNYNSSYICKLLSILHHILVVFGYIGIIVFKTNPCIHVYIILFVYIYHYISVYFNDICFIYSLSNKYCNIDTYKYDNVNFNIGYTLVFNIIYLIYYYRIQ